MSMAKPETAISTECNLVAATQQPGRDLVPTPNGRRLETRADLSMAITSLDQKSFAGRALLANCASPGDLQLERGEILQIRLANYAIFPDVVDKRDGPGIERVTRTCFLSTDGQVYRTTAAHAPEFIARVWQLFTPEELALGIPLQIQIRDSKRADQTYHDFRIVASMD